MNRDYLSISGLFLKASPAEECGERVIYMTASNESTDLQGEKVLVTSLQDSASHFMSYGNVDLDHRTLRPPSFVGDNPYQWEIGRPVDVQFRGDQTIVKAQLYRGESRVAENANMVWDSMTKINPPAMWYPSVGGQIVDRGTDLDPETGNRVGVIRKVRWTNIGLSRTPVNHTIPPVTAEQMCKSWNGSAFVCKALDAGYGTDSATLGGGGALRFQSLDPAVQATLPGGYQAFRESVASAIRCRKCRMTPAGIVSYAVENGVDSLQAQTWAVQFMRDLATSMRGRK